MQKCYENTIYSEKDFNEEKRKTLFKVTDVSLLWLWNAPSFVRRCYQSVKFFNNTDKYFVLKNKQKQNDFQVKNPGNFVLK